MCVVHISFTLVLELYWDAGRTTLIPKARNIIKAVWPQTTQNIGENKFEYC